MADWSKPSLTDAYAAVLAEIMARDLSTATLSYSNDANIPNGAIRWNPNTFQFEIFSSSGGNWSALTTQLNIGTLLLGQNAEPNTMQAIPRMQADAAYQPLGSYAALAGNATQSFSVGPATQPTQATPLQQVKALLQQVQALLGSYSQVIAPDNGAIITSGQANSYIQISGAVTLPNAGSAGVGATLSFKNDSQSPQTISAEDGNFIFSPSQIGDGGKALSISLMPGDDVEFVSRGSSEWDIAGGAWLIRNQANPFFASLAGNANQTFAVGNAEQSNQAVALGQFSDLVPQMITSVVGSTGPGNTAEINLTVNTPGLLFAIGNINISFSSWSLQAAYSNRTILFLDGVNIGSDQTQNIMTNASTRPITAGNHTVQYTVVPTTTGSVGCSYSLWLSIIFIPFLPGYGE